MILFSRFEQQLPAKQLQKGRFYFEEDLVCNLDEAKPGYWKADVSGTTDYQVQVTVANDDITETFCDCPHEVDFCKHVVAVLYAMRALREPDFTTLISRVPEADLRAFAVEFGSGNDEFRELARARFGA